MTETSLGCVYAVVIETAGSSEQRTYSVHLEYDEAMNRAEAYNTSYAMFKPSVDNVAKVVRVKLVPVI